MKPTRSSRIERPSRFAVLVASFVAFGLPCANAQSIHQTEQSSAPESVSSNSAADTLLRGFVNPPPSARLRCYWWWLNGHVTQESIDRDIREMKAKGYGGVLLVDANGANAGGNDPVPAGPTFGSPAWTALFVHAVETAYKLGLEIILTITSGWDLGAPFIQPKDAVKVLTWSRTLAEPKETRLPEPSPKHAFYQRIAVLAYTRTNIRAFKSSSPLMTSGMLGPVRLISVSVQGLK